MWSSASYSSAGGSVASRTLGCFLQGRNRLTVPVGVAAAAAAMARSKEIISLQ